MNGVPPAAVVFDLDGTLVDTSPDIVGAVETLRSECGLEPAGERQVLEWVGEGAPVLVERALADAPGPAVAHDAVGGPYSAGGQGPVT